MDNVNVHYNSSQPAQLNALAYTQGSDIHVAPGQEQHLPHEAWHVVQQAQGRVQPTMQMKDGVPVNDDEGLEHEADVMGAKAVATAAQGSRSYGGLVVSEMTHIASQVQRCMCAEQRTDAEERNGVPSGVGEPYKPVISARLRPHSAKRSSTQHVHSGRMMIARVEV